MVSLGDGGQYSANKLQRESYDFWEKGFWPEVLQTDREIATVLNGEPVDGKHHDTAQVWSTVVEEQVAVAHDILSPIRAKSKHFFITRGTPAHSGQRGAAEEMLHRLLGADFVAKRERTTYRFCPTIGGVRFDFAHHGPNPGNRTWTYGNSFRQYCRNIYLDAMARRKSPPRVIIRSHVHKRTRETLHEYDFTLDGFITPAWQWFTEFVHRIASHEDIADIGGLVIDIDDGNITNAYFKTLGLSQSKELVVE